MYALANFLYIQSMNVRLIHKKSEANIEVADFQALLDRLASLYAGGIEFKYDSDQAAVIVSKSGRSLGTVRAEGALHTIVWATLSLAEKEA